MAAVCVWCATDGVLVCSLFVVLCCALLCSGAAPACRCAVPVGSPVLPALARLPLRGGFRCLFAVQAGRACSSCSSISHHFFSRNSGSRSQRFSVIGIRVHSHACMFLGYTERVSDLFEVGFGFLRSQLSWLLGTGFRCSVAACLAPVTPLFCSDEAADNGGGSRHHGS